MCDTALNKIAKNKPRIQFMTTGGTGTQIKKAKLLTQFIDGAFDQLNIYEKGQRVFFDSEIFGTGSMKFFEDGTNIHAERQFINEIVVDDVQGRDGNPNELYQRRYVSRGALKNVS